jgi:hypothetical protein
VPGAVEGLGERGEAAAPDLDRHARIGQQVVGPHRPVAGRDEDRAIGLVDEADGDVALEARPPAADREPGDGAREDQVAPEIVRGRDSGRGRGQRARCQDLPSVWVEGA